jgi:D-glycero-alpha-D-manno-heptose-7-phosphate kinase
LGGGTDLPAYFQEHEFGQTLSFAINKYVYISMHPLVTKNGILLKYSQQEYRDSAEQIEHPVVRSILSKHGISKVDISISSDVPAGTGLGSSSSFTVGLHQICKEYLRLDYSAEILANDACVTEIIDLGEPIGKQDQYIAAYGGLRRCKYFKSGEVYIESLEVQESHTRTLERHMHLFQIGGTRSASSILKAQLKSMSEQSILSRYHDLKNLVDDGVKAISMLDLKELGKIVHESWKLKRHFSDSISSLEINDLIEFGLKRGAFGAKLLGAGGAGYVLFVAEPAFAEVLIALDKNRYLPVSVDRRGSKVVYSSE